MLAKDNRVTRPSDFRAAVRTGRRLGAPSVLVHMVSRGDSGPTRFGFIVTKAVGGAVVRNRVRRRLRAVCRDILPSLQSGDDVVVRALPACVNVTWASLHLEIAGAVRRGNART